MATKAAPRPLFSRAARMVAVVVLVAAMFAAVTSAPAAACACGALVTPDDTTRVAQEVALVSTDGRTETVVMRLDVQSGTDNAALLVPTPTPAKVSAAGASLFDELERLTAPRVEVKRHWTFGSDAGVDAAAPGAPTVVDQVRLGPLEATTLAGGDLPGVQNWLATHGYSMRPAVVAALEPYLKQGWSVVAMRLTSTTPLQGPLDPVKLEFASDRLVYPMRLSVAAQMTQRVVVYTLDAHRMQRIDPDAADQRVTVEFAGSIAGRTTDPTLTELARRGGYLTRMSVVIRDPAAITSDFVFGPAPSDEPYQRVVTRVESADATPLVLGAGAVIGVLVVLAGVGFVVIRARRRQS